MIELNDIHKSFGTLEVLRGVNLEVTRGEIMAVVGPSGAGKTTLLQIAGTLDRPDSGTLTFSGVNPFALSDKRLSEFRNQHIGFIFQFHKLLPEFSAAENVAMPALIGGTRRKEAMRASMELLELFGLKERATHRPDQLSGGERQRVAIARALVNKPDVVYADEPTGSLDSHNRHEIRRLISRLRDELQQTFVIVTHDSDVETVADRVVTMADGIIL